MAVNYTLNILQGSDYPLRLILKNEDSTYFNLSGYNTRGSIRYKYFNSDIILDLQPMISSYVSGFIDIVIPASGTAAISSSRYIYDVDISNSGGATTRILMGVANISPEVTP